MYTHTQINRAERKNEFIWIQRTRTLQQTLDTNIILAWRGHSLVTDLVPSEIACLASSPGRIKRTDVWISREEIVDFFEYDASSANRVRHMENNLTANNSLDASVAIRSKISLTKLFRMAIALLEIPVSGCTCLSTAIQSKNRSRATNGEIAYPCRCNSSRSPFGPSCASSFHHQRQLLRVSRFSLQL
jgi:hypothetical protein